MLTYYTLQIKKQMYKNVLPIPFYIDISGMRASFKGAHN